MAKIHKVEKARKSPGSCSKCGKTITVGQPYQWTAPRTHRGAKGYKKIACASCRFRHTDTSTSKLAVVLDAREDAQEEIAAAFDAIRGALSTLAQEARDVADEYRESFNNLPENFQLGETGQEMETKADDLESYAQALESCDVDSGEVDSAPEEWNG